MLYVKWLVAVVGHFESIVEYTDVATLFIYYYGVVRSEGPVFAFSQEIGGRNNYGPFGGMGAFCIVDEVYGLGALSLCYITY